MPERVIEAAVRYREELLPPHLESHGTPHPMVSRQLRFELPQRASREQTDYGHPGRFNAVRSRKRIALARFAAAAITPKR